MRILVVGGTLFIGKLLVDVMRQAGHEVLILHRNAHGGPQELVADRNSPEEVWRALAGQRFDVVFDNVYDWQRGTTAEQVLATAQAAQPRHRYVFMSSVGAYVEGLNRVESDPLAYDGPGEYARNKARSERSLFDSGLPVVTLRPPYVYGPGDPFYREAFFWDRLRDGRPILIPGDGQRLMQMVYVGDIVRACVAAIEKPVAGQSFNVAHPQPMTQVDLVRAFAEVAGVDPQLVFVPRERLEGVQGLYFGELYDLPPITQVTTKIEQQLGVTATNFHEALRVTYEDYLRQPRRPVDYSLEDSLLLRA